MDMEVIQEFSENQCYLNALSHSNFQTELEVKVDPVAPAVVENNRVSDSLERVLKEPVGKLLFRAYLRKAGCLDHMLFLDSTDEFEFLPTSSYRIRFAKKVVRQYLDDTSPSKQIISLPFHIIDAIKAKLESGTHQLDELFAAAKQSVLFNLSLSSFHGFVFSRYYERLLSFRMKEANLVDRSAFTFIRVLGEGGFGKVFAVSKNDTRALYACKTMSKQKIIAKKREKLLMNEREILSRVHHPFIVSLSYAFQDDENLYLILNLMSGGELGFHLNRFKRFPEKMVRFYAAGIVLALEHFHSQGIVYRDLKPENIMLDSDGYIRLTDLGLCAVMRPGERLRQHCGTRSYMAPEQCYGEDGYDKSVDWWSLGVTIFHLLTGVNPFSKRYRQRKSTRKEDNPLKVGKAISVASSPAQGRPAAEVEADRRERAQLQALENDTPDEKDISTTKPKSPSAALPSPAVKISSQSVNRKSTKTFGWGGPKDRPDDEKEPQSPGESAEARAERYASLRQSYEETLTYFPWPEKMSRRARTLCEGLMTITPSKRLGFNGAEEVKSHPFFDGVNWHKLRERHVAPPFIPERDYVNAKFLEAAAGAFNQSKKKMAPSPRFEGFDFIRPSVFQEEIMQTIHDKEALVGES